MTILVTGAAGFIGRNLLKHLTAAHPNASIVPTDLETLDIRDRPACFHLLRRIKPTHLIHGAALTLPGDTLESAQLIHAVNFCGTRNVLDAAVAAGSLQRILILSSSAVYGPDTSHEDDILDPIGAYAVAKQQAEQLMPAFEEQGGFVIAVARIGPVYGPFEHPSPTRPRTSLIHQLREALLENRTIRVSGTDMHRDWTHAADIAAALDALLFAPALNYRIYNVSTGQSISARAIIALFQKHGLNAECTSDAYHADIVLAEQQSRKPLVIDRLRQDTGFTPRFDIQSFIHDPI